MEVREEDPATILRELKRGLLVTKMGGGEVNTTTGEFVFGVEEGYEVEDGTIKHRVRDASILGNGPEVLKSIDRLGWDIGWAATYTAFLVIATSLALRRAFPAGYPQRRLNLPALVPGLLDLAENAGGIVLVANADSRLDALAWFVAGLTSAKWVTLVIAHLVLLYAGLAALRATIRSRRPGTADQR